MPHASVERRITPEGPWQKLLPGVYLTVTGRPAEDQREVAALLYAGPESVITGPTAIRRHRLRSPGPDMIDVLIPWAVRRQSTGFVRVHRTRQMPGFYSTGAIRFAIPARAVVDAAHGFASLDDVRTVVAEVVQKRACTIAEIGIELERGTCRDTANLRVALAELRAGIRSAAEAHFLKRIGRSGLPMPAFNVQLVTVDGTFIAQVDAWWADAGVAVEIDSQEFHFSRADWLSTEARHSRMLKYGILPHHFAPSRIKTDWETVYDELRSSIAKGLERPRLPIVALRPAA
ncbi:MAG TPA: hypothetical protein VF482_10455 [Trebonia sp.]